MSRVVIRDIVLPIVEKIMREQGYSPRYGHVPVEDARFDEYLEKEMRRYFGVIGANECQHLREQLEEAKRNDPYAFEFLIKQLLGEYAKQAIKERTAEMKLKAGPPDRFLQQRRNYPVFNYQEGSR